MSHKQMPLALSEPHSSSANGVVASHGRDVVTIS